MMLREMDQEGLSVPLGYLYCWTMKHRYSILEKVLVSGTFGVLVRFGYIPIIIIFLKKKLGTARV